MTHAASSPVSGKVSLRIIIAVLLAIPCSLLLLAISHRLPHVILIDGVTVARTRSLQAAKDAVREATAMATGKPVSARIRLRQRISYHRAPNSSRLMDTREAALAVSKAITAESLLYAICSNGKPFAALPGKGDAIEALEELKLRYRNLPGGIKGDCEFRDKVEIKRQYVPIRIACASVDEAVKLLASDVTPPILHRVAHGERAFNIANQYHVSVADLTRLNPGADVNLLEDGQKLVIRPGVKPITVVTRAFVTMSAQLALPPEVYRRSKRFGGSRTTKMVMIYENGQPVNSEIISQVTTWKRPRLRESRRTRRHGTSTAGTGAAVAPALKNVGVPMNTAPPPPAPGANPP